MFLEPVYSVTEAAKQAHLSPWTIWDLLKRGHLVRTKISGKTFIRESELRKLVRDEINPKRKSTRKPKAEAKVQQ